MKDLTGLSVGAVVLSGRQSMIVIVVDGEGVLACPLVGVDEPRHRSDIVLEWHELVDAGLACLKVRGRAVACYRERVRLGVLGHVAPDVAERFLKAAQREQGVRAGEGVLPRWREERLQGSRGGLRRGGVRSVVWTGAVSLKSLREQGERVHQGV